MARGSHQGSLLGCWSQLQRDSEELSAGGHVPSLLRQDPVPMSVLKPLLGLSWYLLPHRAMWATKNKDPETSVSA